MAVRIINQDKGIDEIGRGVTETRTGSNVEVRSQTSGPDIHTDGVLALRSIAAADQRAAAVSVPALESTTPRRYGLLAGFADRLGKVYDWLAGPAATQQDREEATRVYAQDISKGISYL